jgi:hypothetical protein
MPAEWDDVAEDASQATWTSTVVGKGSKYRSGESTDCLEEARAL